MEAKKIVHYQTDAKKASPELEKLKEEKLEADRRLSEERKLLVETQRKLRDMELARRRKDLVEAAVVTREAQDITIIIRSRMLLLPTQLARKCVGKSQHEIRTIIDAGIREALTELSNLTDITCAHRRSRHSRDA